MGFNTNQQTDTGIFVPTTTVFDLQRLYDTDTKSEDFKQILVKLYQTVNSIVLALNIKDSGYYVLSEFNTGQLYFNPASTDPQQLRIVFRKVVNIGALGPGVTTVAHGLAVPVAPPYWTFIKIYGVANDGATSNYYPLPWASAGGATNIELRVDNTNVIITNNSGVAFALSGVVLEYVKN